MTHILKHKHTLIGVLIGAIVGYLYYHFVGCMTDTCAMTSRPLNSTLYGALLGGLVCNMFHKEKSKTE
ncbi:DUF6132 family protein [Formosa undariae]|uniref:DUF6132 family protein n=1 Tax=Formosa undariae TaxID=1325436 RepID=A0ABV5F3L9_9FLAO